MAGQPNVTLGAIACPLCHEDIPVRKNGRDTLNISCPWCQASGYVKPGTKGHAIVMGWLGQENKPEPEKQPEKQRGYF